MADEPTKKTFIHRSMDRVLKFMGITVPSNDEVVQGVVNAAKPVRIPSYSVTEMETMIQSVRPVSVTNDVQQAISTMMAKMKSVSSNVSNRTIESRNLKTLSPEISQAKTIMVSSIMSPNDMQTEQIGIDINMPELDEDVSASVKECLENFFNNDLKLGTKVTRWIGDCLFETGSQPVVIVPKSNLRMLDKFNKANAPKTPTRVNPQGKPDKVEVSMESLIGTDIIDADVEDMTIGLEGLLPDKDPDYTLLTSATKNVVAKIHELIHKKKNSIILSNSAVTLLENQVKLEEVNSAMKKKFDKMFIGSDKLSDKQLMIMSEELDIDDTDHPILLELPPQSVIPVTVPNSPEEHFGYFILLDEWGNPVAPSPVPEASSGSTSSSVSNRVVQTIYGGSLSPFSQDLTAAQKNDMALSVFNKILGKTLCEFLKKDDIEGVTIGRHDAMASYVLHHLLKNPDEAGSKLKLIFVPASLVIYYAFDYRDDGTGKSLLEDLSLIIALRNTLFVAGVMAATRNAIDNKTVEVQVDEKNVNLEQTLDLVRNIFTEKHMFKFDNNPFNIARDLVQKSLTIVPRGIKGLSDGLSVNHEHRASNVTQPDDSLMEKLTTIFINGLEVPHTALNQLSEHEYSRSVVTNNLFFSNNIRHKQAIVNEKNTALIKQYIKYSYPLQKRLSQIIGEGLVKYDKKAIKAKKNVKQTEETTDEKITKMMSKLIGRIKATLPAVTLSIDKAHFEELRGYVDIIDGVIDRMYPDELATGSAQDLQETLRTLKSNIKASAIRDFIDSVGFTRGFELPNLEHIEPTAIYDTLQQLLNFKKGMDTHLIKLSKADEQAEEQQPGGAPTPGW